MLNIVLYGAPGLGKGSQVQKLVETYNLVHLAMGDILRLEIQNQTALGMEAKRAMDQGMLVSEHLVIEMINSRLAANENAAGFIFDGFPGTVEQAQMLDKLLEAKGSSITMMIEIEVSEEELVRRALVISDKYSEKFKDEQNVDNARRRIHEYNSKILPLKDHYLTLGKFHFVDGAGVLMKFLIVSAKPYIIIANK